jgi:gamma-glutamylcyclotransferase (GGCT)/AIG2-like uncharacterized protein YtfP
MRIFVYGTLRSGGSNHHFLRGSVCAEQNVRLSGYIMYNFGKYPFVKPCADTNRTILGEIYEISADTLQRLDKLEGTDVGLYERIFDDNIDAWLYVSGANAPDNLPEIKSGDWFAAFSD